MTQTLFAAVLSLSLLLGASTALAQNGNRGATRIDFDNTLIKGQTKRGAVQLLERRDSQLGSLVKTRVSFRENILREAGLEPEASGLQRSEVEVTDGERSEIKRPAHRVDMGKRARVKHTQVAEVAHKRRKKK